MILYGELERTAEAVITCFMVLFQFLVRMTEKKHKNLIRVGRALADSPCKIKTKHLLKTSLE
jgi:hypothetical protein